MPRRKSALSSLLDGPREQTILTPGWMISQLIASAGRLILDPCTTAVNNLGALLWADGAPGRDGKAISWTSVVQALGPGFVYVNPPFNDLEDWLAKAAQEAALGCPIWFLGPNRTARPWMAKHLAEATVYTLRQLAFEGIKDTYPAALFLAGWNVPPLEQLLFKGREMRLAHQILVAL